MSGYHLGAAALLMLAALVSSQEDPLEEGKKIGQRGADLVEAGKFAEGRALLEQAIILYGKASAPFNAGLAWSWIAISYHKERRWPEAVQAHRESVRQLRAAGEKGRGQLATELNSLTFSLMQLERWDDALKATEEAVEVERARGNTRAVAVNLQNLGTVLVYLDRADEALVKLREAHAIAERLKDPELMAHTTMNLGGALWRVGRAEESLRAQKEGIVLIKRAQGEESVVAAAAHVNLAESLQRLGRIEEALANVHIGIAVFRKHCAANDPRIPWSRFIRANCLMNQGKLVEALALLHAVRKRRESILPPGHPDIAVTYENLGECHYQLGRFAEALPYYRKGLELQRAFTRGRPSADVARAEDNLGRCLRRLGRFEKALEHSSAALKMYRRLYGDRPHVDVSVALGNVAVCLQLLGRTDEAIARFEESIAAAQHLPGGWDEALGQSQVAALLHQEGRHEEALVKATAALAQLRESGAPRGVASAEAVLGFILLDGLRKSDEAVPHFAVAIEKMEGLRAQAGALREPERAAFFESMRTIDPFGGMVRAQVALGQTGRALGFLERGRGRSMLDLLARSRVDPLHEARRGAVPPETVRDMRAAVARAEREVGRLTYLIGRAGSDRKKRNELGGQLRAARRAHAQALRERARLVHDAMPLATPADTPEIQGLLDKDERMLVYEIGATDSLLLLVPPPGQRVRTYRLPATHERLTDLVRDYRIAIERNGFVARGLPLGGNRPGRSAAELGSALFEALVPRGVWKELRGLARVYVVPHGPVHQIPLEALIVKRGKDAAAHTYWLDAGPPLAYGSSGSALVRCRQRRAAQRGASSRYRAVALGDARFGDRLAPLDGTRKEVLAVQRILGGEEKDTVAILVGKDANKPRLAKLAPQARYLHLATHHLVDETDYGSYSRLALTLPEKVTPDDDGFLTLVEVLEHWRGRLDNCELVVLSACSTQQGALQRDEGIHAMPLGFLYAGCPSVIASLWVARDQPTAELMTRFYERLAAQEGRNKLGAFTVARQALRKKHSQPYFWAPFIYIGEPR